LIAAVAGIAFAVILMLVQLGFEEALLTSAATNRSSLNCDIVLISPEYQYIMGTSHFSEQRLAQALAFEEVESVNKIYLAPTMLKNPRHRADRASLTMGFRPERGVINVPEVNQSIDLLRDPDVALFDEHCRPEFAAIPADFRKGLPVEVELGRRKVKIAGLFSLGASFGIDGNIIVSDQQFFRIFPYRHPSEVDLGLVRLKPGADPERVRVKLARLIEPEVKVLTHQGMIDYEKHYWSADTPIGFVFRLGVVTGLFVGLIIVYQILHADVTDHLREYATLKAIGYKDRALGSIVVEESAILSVFGFIPGLAISAGVYHVAAAATFLPLHLTLNRIVLVYFLTLAMCVLSGLLAARRLRSADPAEIFN
jgi:putative ABC transport system permease protein